MKSLFFLLVFSLALVVTSSSQRIGIKAGGNFTNVTGKDGTGEKQEGHKFVPGFHVGALGQIDLGETVSLQIEGCYSTKGFKDVSKSSLTSGTTTVTSEVDVLYTYSYVDVPLLLNIHFGQMGSYIGFGPQLGFLMGAKWDGTMKNTSTNTGTSPPTTSSQEFTFAGKDKTGISKTDFSVVFGTGSKWDSGIEYCLRGGLGLSNIIDQSVSTSNAIWHHVVFSVSLGYTFGVGGGGGKDRYGNKFNKKKRR